jgi:4-hydroxythreonine-4-phosphate dehydrogenase
VFLSIHKTITFDQTSMKLGLTMGDPNGIGPEVLLRALTQLQPFDGWEPLIFGDLEVLESMAAQLGSSLRLQAVLAADTPVAAGAIPVRNLAVSKDRCWELGRCDPWGGESAFRFVHEAIVAANQGKIAAIVTGPLAKAALQAAGHDFPGHTEMLAHYTNTPRSVMMLVVDQLRAVMATLHLSLREAIDTLTPELLVDTMRITDQALRRMGVSEPRLGIPGLNPHAGENGLFGSEEQEIILPAIAQARQQGIQCSMPISPDAIFLQHQQGRFDAVIALYHDQALIPLKLIGFDRAVNVTLGLPIIRTSVDHGTAFDLAPQLNANPGSMLAAIAMAQQFASGAKGAGSSGS